MTLWQDPPPQSRRQVRERERAVAEQAELAGRSRRAATIAPTAAGQIPDVSTPYGSTASTRTDSVSAPSAVRPVPPRYDGLAFDTLVSANPAPTELYQAAPPPPGRPEPVTSPLAIVAPVPTARPADPVADALVNPPSVQTSTPGHTLTRRELRAMLQAQEANQQAAAPVAPVTPQAPAAPLAQPVVAEFTPAPIVVGPPAPAQAAVIPIAALPVPTTPRVEQQSLFPQPAVQQPVAAPPIPAPVSDYVSAAASTVAPAPELTVTTTHHAATAPRPYAPASDPWMLATSGSESGSGEAAAPGYARSTVTTGSTTTSNALIIPTVPSAADALGPLTSTGEILVTGSIDLPRSLAATGQHSDRMDTSAIDRLFEQPEAGEHTPSSVAPIRASRAVSSHTSTRDVITPPRGRGNKLPTILAITAAVLALGVIGLLVAGYVFKAF
ncbi:MAG TPA: hypothetical protein VIJ18_15940 [Microbacteriaceae bacterium]